MPPSVHGLKQESIFPEFQVKFKTPEPVKRDSPKNSIDNEGRLKLVNTGTINAEGCELNGRNFYIAAKDLEFLSIIGEGQFGVVQKARHKKTNQIMAVKRIRVENSERGFKQIKTELSVLQNNSNPFIVDFYGAFFYETYLYFCIEFMDFASIDKVCGRGIPEPVLSKVAFSVVHALKCLKEELNIIHRDVRPSNILLNSAGQIKVCDFNVSGELVNSVAKTVTGCQLYMSPERITASRDNPYGVASDIWSFGLSLIELALGEYPYPKPKTIFGHLDYIVKSEPPQLSRNRFSPEFCDFVSVCLKKDPNERGNLNTLQAHPFLYKYPDYDIQTWLATLTPN